MAANYVLIQKIVVGAATAGSISFNNIPQTGYSDLKIVASVRGTTGSGTGDSIYMRFNNDSGSNYSLKQIYGDGTAAYSVNYSASSYFGSTIGFSGGNTGTANTFGNSEIYIPKFTNTNAYKVAQFDVLSETNSAVANATYITKGYGIWNSNAAITSILIGPWSSNFGQYSSFYLYGIANSSVTPAIAPYATGGDVVTTDGTYWYHTFTSTGTFTPRKAITCDYLVVAGGGGGGRDSYTDARRAGGGGAGGYRTSIGGSPLSLATSAYTVTVGGGGPGATTANNGNGTNGSNSVFSTITSTGGGFGCGTAVGGAVTIAPVPNGGSGGGGSGGGGNNLVNGNAGLFSPVEGYGGNDGGYSAPNFFGGGGGGSSANAPTGGVGGAGTANSISGSSVTYAGGGGGGGSIGLAGGTGGGGAGSSGAGTAGTANLGGGGGGSRNTTGGAGGSGIVIVRYAV
jgi:hypothetical protein